MKKRFLSMLLVATMATALFAGCGGGSANSGTKSDSGEKQETSTDTGAKTKYPRNEQGYPDLGGQTITIWHNPTNENVQAFGNGDLGDFTVIKELEEKFNVNLEFIHPPVGQAQENFTVMLAGDELPDMIFCGGIDSYYPGGVEMAYADGILYDYTDLVNEENTPNFWKLINSDENLRKSVTDDQGRIVYLGGKICGSEDADFDYTGLLIRKDYLEAAGLTEPPTTIDGWTEMLAAMKANGVEYPLAVPKSGGAGNFFSNNTFSSAYGVSAGNFYVKDNGDVGYGPYEDAYKDFVTLLNSWYKAGYINPDFATQEENDIMSLAADDKVGSMIMHLWTYGANYYVTTEEPNPEKAMVAAPIPVLNEGDKIAPLRSTSRSIGDKKYITVDAKDPEACVALLDALYLADIDLMLAEGVEGVAFNLNSEGIVVREPIPEDADQQRLLDGIPQQWHTTEDVDRKAILTSKYNKGAQPDCLLLSAEVGSEGRISRDIMYTEAESEIRSQYMSDVTTYVQEMFLKFVTGTESLDKFADYQATLKDMHIEDLIAATDAAQKRVALR